MAVLVAAVGVTIILLVVVLRQVKVVMAAYQEAAVAILREVAVAVRELLVAIHLAL